ncbi:MAG: right-handed parallel beta-helix repeat-containing protein [bacterium]
MKKLLFIFFLLKLAVCASIGIEISGIIDSNTVWTSAGGPVSISGNIIVKESIVLKIEPGVEVKVNGDFRLLVKGRLEARGTSQKPIKFYFGLSKSPKKSDWQGIQFFGKNAGGFLSYCEIRNAYKNLIRNCSPIIENCLLKSNSYAVYCSYSQGAKIYNNHITGNDYGVFCDYSSPIIQKNKIINNLFGIYCILSASPIVGENTVANNQEKDIYLDETMGGNKAQSINDHVYDLMKDIF